jgi:PKD repeat protein
VVTCTYSRIEAGLGFDIVFTPTVSSPEHVTLGDYSYDTDGDGTSELDSSISPQTFNYGTPGLYKPKISVTDENGKTASAPTQVIKIWSADLVMSNIKFVRTAVVNGLPAMLALQPNMAAGGGSLHFMRATDAKANAWTTVTVVTDSLLQNDIAAFDLIDIPGSGPAIVYPLGANLNYLPATNQDGSAWGTNRLIGVSPGGSFLDASMALRNNGLPAVCYVLNATGTAVYANSDGVLGLNWVPATINITGVADCDLKIIDGFPCIAFSQGNNAIMRRAVNTDGSAWNFASAPELVIAGTGNIFKTTLTELFPLDTNTRSLALGAVNVSTSSSLPFRASISPEFFTGFNTNIIQPFSHQVFDLSTVYRLPCAAHSNSNDSLFYFMRGANGFGQPINASPAFNAIPLLPGGGISTAVDILPWTAAAVAVVNASGGLHYCAEPNAAPQAFLIPDVETGPAPLTVNFDASRSWDPEGALVEIKWELADGLGAVVLGPGGNQRQTTYNEAGTYNAKVTVTDASGQTATVTKVIVVT